MRYTAEDLKYLTATVYGEARGESFEGRCAVAWTIINRVNAESWYGRTIKDVCLKPWQYSCWNANDPNHSTLKEMIRDWPKPMEGNKVLHGCLLAVLSVLYEMEGDRTQGSTHYHVASISPHWIEGKMPVVAIGAHKFYNDID